MVNQKIWILPLIVVLYFFYTPNSSAYINWIEKLQQAQKDGTLPKNLEGIKTWFGDQGQEQYKEDVEIIKNNFDAKEFEFNNASGNFNKIETNESRSSQCKNGTRKIISFEPAFTREVSRSEGEGIVIAHCSSTNSIEIIAPSGTDRRKRDFIVIENIYDDDKDNFIENKNFKPKIKTINSKECIVCHQGGKLIFTPEPWREFSRKNNPDIRIVRVFDLFVRDTSAKLQRERLCAELCPKGDILCRQYMLKSAFFIDGDLGPPGPKANNVKWNDYLLDIDYVNNFTKDSFPTYHDDFQNRITRNWPSDNYASVSSVLPDILKKGNKTRAEVFPAESQNSVSADTRRSFLNDYSNESTYQEDVAEGRAMGNIVSNKYAASEEKSKLMLDPTTQRPKIREIPKKNAAIVAYQIAHTCLDLNLGSPAKKFFDKQDPELISTIISSGAMDEFLKTEHDDGAWKIDALKIQVALANEIQKIKNARPEIPEESKDGSAHTNSSQKVNALQVNPEEQKIVLGALKRSCIECHASDSDSSLKISDDTSFADLKNYVAKKGRYKGLSISEIISKGLMPPPEEKENKNGSGNDSHGVLDEKTKSFILEKLGK